MHDGTEGTKRKELTRRDVLCGAGAIALTGFVTPDFICTQETSREGVVATNGVPDLRSGEQRQRTSREAYPRFPTLWFDGSKYGPSIMSSTQRYWAAPR
jgi:hypothetical protein